jgi:hypothetical protein
VTPVDRDRQAVYDLEDAALGGTTFDDLLPFAEAAALVGAFCVDDAWQSLGVPAPAVHRTRRDSYTSYARCDADGASIHLAPGGCTVAVVAHELAHVVVAHSAGEACSPEPDHGSAFRRADVRLAGALMGATAAERLATAFRGAGLALGPADPLAPQPGPVGFALRWRTERAARAGVARPVSPPIPL